MSAPMTRRILSIATALLAVRVATIPIARADDSNPVERTYSVYNIDPQDARLLIGEKLGDALRACGNTRVEALNNRRSQDQPIGYVSFICSPATQERIGGILEQYDAPPRSFAFQIVLLEGSLEPGASPALAPGPRKALDDVRQMLPFKGYRLLETGLFRTAEEGHVTIGSGFEAWMKIRSSREPSAPVFVREFSVVKVALDTRHIFINTSFSIKVNETIVVGTSKLNGGDKALVVLVTGLD